MNKKLIYITASMISVLAFTGYFVFDKENNDNKEANQITSVKSPLHPILKDHNNSVSDKVNVVKNETPTNKPLMNSNSVSIDKTEPNSIIDEPSLEHKINGNVYFKEISIDEVGFEPNDIITKLYPDGEVTGKINNYIPIEIDVIGLKNSLFKGEIDKFDLEIANREYSMSYSFNKLKLKDNGRFMAVFYNKAYALYIHGNNNITDKELQMKFFDFQSGVNNLYLENNKGYIYDVYK